MSSRVIVPEEFYDITSAKLLVEPERQYLYARLFLDAVAIDLDVMGALGLGDRAITGVGADYSDLEADRLALQQRLLPAQDIFAVAHDFNAAPGHTVRFNRPRYTNTTYTEASRRIPVGNTITTTAVQVGASQIPLTLFRYGGPYDATNARVAPYPIEAFDANMGVHKLSQLVGNHVKRDFHRFLDSVYTLILDDGATQVFPEGMSVANDATSAGQFPLTYEQCSRTSATMDTADLPTLPDGRRILVVTPTGKKQLKDDPQFARYAEFHKEVNPLFPGYFGSTPEFHCFVSNSLTTTDNSSSVAIHNGHAIAPGALMGGIGRPPRVAASTADNYGETALVVWLADLAMGKADTRFVYRVSYTEDA